MLKLLTILAAMLAPPQTWTGLSCCDQNNYYFSACSPMAYLADMNGCGDNIDSAPAWCDTALAAECIELVTAGPDHKCCKPGETEQCIWPVGEAWAGPALWAVACEADREPSVCFGGWTWAGDGWDC